LDDKVASDLATKLSKLPAKGRLSTAISSIMVKYGDESAYDYIADNFDKMPLSQAKFQSLGSFVEILTKVKDSTKFKAGIDKIVAFRDAIPESARAQTTPYINNTFLKGIADKKEKAGEKDLSDYVKSKL
jgi:aminopeptidase N